MTHKFPSFVDDSFGNPPQFPPLFIQVAEALTAALANRFPRLFAREQRGHQAADGPETQPDQQKGKFEFTVGSHAYPLICYAHTDTVWR